MIVNIVPEFINLDIFNTYHNFQINDVGFYRIPINVCLNDT